MGRILYHIRTDWDGVFITNPSGQNLEADELLRVISKLQELHTCMVSEQLDQESIKSTLYETLMYPIMDGIKVLYPCTLPHINWRPNQKRPRRSPRYKGVYFVTHPDYPSCVKIGCSVNVYQRTKSLFHEYGKKVLTVLAFIPTDDFEAVEGYLHKQFIYYRKVGEFFALPPVEEWLERQTGSAS